MQVLINDCPVDFELEQDRKVSDVINSISEWTRERDLVFYEMYIDDDCYPVDAAPDISLCRREGHQLHRAVKGGYRVFLG